MIRTCTGLLVVALSVRIQGIVRRPVIVWDGAPSLFVVTLMMILIVGLVRSVLDDLWLTLLLGLDDEWVSSHSECSDESTLLSSGPSRVGVLLGM